MIDVWVTFSEAMQLTQLSRSSVYQNVRISWVTRPRWGTRGNGRNPREIALYSLPPYAQALYWMGRRCAPLCSLLDSDVPGMSHSDFSDERAVHHA